MSPERAYLDHNATSPLRPEVRAAVIAAMDGAGNPSSVHREGRDARALVEAAREEVAALIGARPETVLFTGGGTEANCTALRPGALLARDGRPVRRLVHSAADHASVRDGHRFPPGDVVTARVGPDGRLDLAGLSAALGPGGEPALVSVAAANSETGILEDVAAVAARVAAVDGVLHVDAVQAAGRVPVRIGDGVDAVTLSAHKLGGPMGVGALAVLDGRAGPGLALLRGGGQEARRRSGTHNVPGIVGFGVAARLARLTLDAEAGRLGALRDAAECAVRRAAPDAVVFGSGTPRLPNTLAFAVPGLRAETVLMALDLDGVAVSSGSACSSGKVGASHVLAAMGVPADLAAGAVRVSLGWSSTHEDVTRFAAAFESVVQRLYERRRAA